MNKSTNNKNLILAITVLGMALIQAPLMLYYNYGMLAIFTIPLFALIGLLLTITLLRRNFDFEKNKITSRYFYIAIVSFLIGIATFFFTENYLTELDWKLRLSERNKIVHQIKNGELDLQKRISKIKLNNFPPISNGGNEILVTKENDQSIIVEFFIDRGFLDHYSSYIYTDNEAKKKELDNRIRLNLKYFHKNEKLSENWYRVSY